MDRMKLVGVILFVLLSFSVSWAFGEAASEGAIVWMTRDLGAIRDLSWSPDGRLIAAITDEGVVLLNSSSGDVELLLEISSPLDVDWCTLGRIGVVTQRSILILSDSGEELARVDLKDVVDEGLVQWSPDCELLAVGTLKLAPKGETGLLALITSGGGVKTMAELESGVSSLRWSPSSDLLAVGLDNGRIMVFSKEGKQVWTARAGLALTYGDALLSLSWSPDSSQVVAGLGSSVVVCYTSDGRELWRSGLLGPPVASLDWSHGGIAAAYGGRVTVLNSSGQEVWSTPDYGKPIVEVRWNSRGDRLAILAYRWLVLVSPEGAVLWSTGLLPSRATAVAWSPTGGAIAVGGLFGAAVFLTSPIEIQVPQSVTVFGGRAELSLSLENLAPVSVEATLKVSVDGNLAEDVNLLLPPGKTRLNLTIEVPPGRHTVDLECESPGGVSRASTKVTSIEPLEITVWATHSPGSPVDLVAAISNTNPMTLPARLVILDQGLEVAELPINLSPGVTYANLSLPLDPGVHALGAKVVDPTGAVLAEDSLSVSVIGPSVPLRIEAPSGVKLGSAEVQVAVENPYPLVLNVTLEAWADSALAYRENLSLREGESREITLTLPSGKHTLLVRASYSGFTLAEQVEEVSTIPTWLAAAVAGAVLLLVVAILSRARSRSSES